MNFLGIDVVNAAFGNVEGRFAINPYMTFCEHFMRLGIITRRVRINIGVAQVNRDVPMCDGDAIFVSRLAAGSNFDWLIFRRFEINSANPGGSKNEKKKNCCPRWHGAPEGTARPRGCKGKTGTHESSERYFSVKAQRKPPDLLIHSTGKNQSASSANRLD